MSGKEWNTSDAVTLETRENIAVITLKRPAKMNAMTQAMWRALPSLAEEIDRSDSTRVVVLCGAGEHFCAGADIGEFQKVRFDARSARAYENDNARAFAAIRKLKIPVIASISGVCFGGGFGLAAACDLRLASADARFSVPAARLGLAYPAEAMADIVHSCGIQMARFLTYTGATIDAREALRCGFLLEIASEKPVHEGALEIARSIAGNAPLSVRASKMAVAAALSGEEADLLRARAMGDVTFDSTDYNEGRAAFAQRRTPQFRGE